MVLDFAPSVTLLSLNFVRKSREEAPDLPELSLRTRALQQNPEIFSLLSWHTQASKFAGREQELAELHAWAQDSDRSLSMRFVVGPGGVGKTRLAAQLGQELRKKGWAAGFVDLRHAGSFRLGEAGTLLLVDYPEQQLDRVDALFQDLAALEDKKDKPDKLRILFLTRSSFEGWRERALNQGVLDLIEGQAVVPGPLKKVDAQTIVNSVQETTGNLVMCADLEPPKPFRANEVEEWMRQRPEHQLPLFLVAAGVYSALHPEADALSFTGPELVLALVDRELMRLNQASEAMGLGSKQALPLLLALATMAGGLAWEQVEEHWAELHPLLGAPEHWDGKDLLAEAGWLSGEEIPSLTPDIVGAGFVVQVLGKKPKLAPKLAALATRLADKEHFVTVLARLDYDARERLGMDQTPAAWLAQALEGNMDLCCELAWFSYRPLPHTLAPLGVQICRAVLSDELSESDRAKHLSNLSVHLSSLGSHWTALQTVQEATDIYWNLVQNNPDEFLPYLGKSFNNLANRLFNSGDYQAALQASQQAVNIHKKLARDNPARFLPDLATSLNNLSIDLSEAGNHQAGLQAAQEVVNIRKVLAKKIPSKFLPVLASSLNNLSNRYSKTGHPQAALQTIQEAVETYRNLAKDNPAQFLPELAGSLNNLSNRLSEATNTRAALQASKEAVAIYKDLTEDTPARFLPDLAMSLNNLSNRLSDAGDNKAALEAIQEAVQIRRALVKESPARFLPDLAMSCGARGRTLVRAGELTAATESFREGMEIMEPFAQQYPGTPMERLYLALKNEYEQAKEHLAANSDD